jgi:hypothetical protein
MSDDAKGLLWAVAAMLVIVSISILSVPMPPRRHK